jgi:peptidoglycan/LPS O-acetylase OafA/YrhL
LSPLICAHAVSPHRPIFGLAFGTAALTIGASMIGFRFIEKPFVELGRMSGTK